MLTAVKFSNNFSLSRFNVLLQCFCNLRHCLYNLLLTFGTSNGTPLLRNARFLLWGSCESDKVAKWASIKSYDLILNFSLGWRWGQVAKSDLLFLSDNVLYSTMSSVVVRDHPEVANVADRQIRKELTSESDTILWVLVASTWARVRLRFI